MRPRPLAVLLVLASFLAPPLTAQGWPGRAGLEAEACTPWAEASTSTDWLNRAVRATGLSGADGKLLRWSGNETDVQFFQSDRPYPPFLQGVSAREWTYDPVSGVERAAAGGGPVVLSTDRATFMARDTVVRAVPQAHSYYSPGRDLNPYAVLHRFQEGSAQLVATCSFRGFPRVVLELSGDRLFLDEKSGMPVKLERMEAHPTWGQVRVEYVYTTWWRGEGVSIPIAAVRYIDGVEQLRRDVDLPRRPGDLVVRRLVPDSAPPMRVPEADHRAVGDPFQREVPVDTQRVGPDTYLLKTRMYTHAVTLQRDTVFLFDATMADWRSRADSVWIASLFPGSHPMVLVVTDLAWPHVGGVRFWSARGATIVSHNLSRPFLEQLLSRRWTLQPDALELTRRQGGRTPPLVTTASEISLAGGAVVIAPIDGPSSEGALYVRVIPVGFLWAGDYIQDVSAPSQYASEVIAAVSRDGGTPEQVAAQHLPLTSWSAVRDANVAP